MRIRPVLGRLGLVLFGLVLGVLALEAILRLGALFAGPRAQEDRPPGDREVILCLGDSHTYGVYYQPEQAYPGQLQGLLDGRVPGRFRVVNLGVPGMNSSQVRARLPAWLDRYRPSTIVFSGGINNLWNVSDTALSGRSLLARAVQSLRVYRLMRIVAASFSRSEPPAGEATGRPHLERSPLAGGDNGVEQVDSSTGRVVARHVGDPRERLELGYVTELLWADLDAIERLASRRGVRLIVLTYAAFPTPDHPRWFSNFHALNETLRRFGRDRRIRVVDLRERFLHLLATAPARTAYFASERDDHPNPRGYAEIAALVGEAMLPRTPG